MPRPFPKKISQIKPTLSNVAQTSHYAVTFAGFSNILADYLKTKGILGRYIADDLSLLCCRASLPGSAHATASVVGKYQGMAQKFAHTRSFTEMSMDFYVDNDYKSLKFLEHWMEFISSGSRLEGESANPVADGYYFRMQYPDAYKCSETRIVKFERDYKNYIEYKFINLFPLSLDAMQVSYEGSKILKATASFTYDYHIAGRSRSLDRQLDESENNDSSQLKAQNALTETVRARNVNGLDDITGYAQRPYNEDLDGVQKLIADGRFLNSGDGGSTIISEGVRGSSGSTRIA